MAKYKVVLLPIASDDLIDIVTYITEKLHAPKAAESFLTTFDKLVDQLSFHPYSHELYRDERNLEYEVRHASVKNYIVFYVVADKTVEIHRVLYGGRDMTQQEL
ncbi:MAG: type II toxin-antitoxin system RelE/ParE family toxin [Treponema sp.]|jgi:plasmid stabilization system protein ParE|nr:type II toxin-antitoxin system RelE/ParE family toxin [Treponema sp.]